MHTPEPWTTDKRAGYIWILGPEDLELARVVTGVGDAESNAALMVAAPKMLGALERLEWSADRFVDWETKEPHGFCPACECPDTAPHAPDCYLAEAIREARRGQLNAPFLRRSARYDRERDEQHREQDVERAHPVLRRRG